MSDAVRRSSSRAYSGAVVAGSRIEHDARLLGLFFTHIIEQTLDISWGTRIKSWEFPACRSSAGAK